MHDGNLEVALLGSSMDELIRRGVCGRWKLDDLVGPEESVFLCDTYC